MADISSYLAAIMSAVYGEDVRGSIHDAIEIINDVSEVVLTTGTAVTGPTSSSTGYYTDSLYLNTSTMELWKCVGTNSWASQGNLKGADGNGITDISKTSTSGLVDTYTITFDDGGTETFDITNGADGQNGSKWYKGTAISGTGTSITGFPGVVNDFYLNSSTGYVYTCTKTGGSLVPDAAEWDYVMALTGGGGGSTVTVIDNLTSSSSTDALSANQGRVLKGYVDAKADAADVTAIQNVIPTTASTSNKLATNSDLPTVNGSTLTIQHNNAPVATYNASASGSGSVVADIYTDTWTGTSLVQSDGTVTFTNLNDNYGYDLYYTLPSGDSDYCYSKVNKTGSGTSVTAVYTTNAPAGTMCKLRILK